MRTRTWVGLVVVACIVAGVAYLAVQLLGNQRTPTIGGQGAVSDFSPTGTLYLTLQSPADGTLKSYTYTVHDTALKPYLAAVEGNTATPSISFDGKSIAFAVRPATSTVFQIYTANADGSNMVQLTQTPEKFKREPVWSPDSSMIAYTTAPEQATTNSQLPSNWQTFIVSVATKRVLGVVQGIDAFLSPDGKTLFTLQNDGLHEVSIAGLSDTSHSTRATTLSQKTKLVFRTPSFGENQSLTTTALQSMKISVSADGTHLAWSSPLDGAVNVYKVDDWQPLTLTLEKTIPIRAFYSVFSPDGKYLALQQVERLPTGALGNAKIVLYRLSDYISEVALSLGQYPITYMWLSAWR